MRNSKTYNILLSCYSGEKDSGDETMLFCIREQLEKELGKNFKLVAFSNNPDFSKEFVSDVEYVYSGRYGLKDPSEKGIKKYRWIFKMIQELRKCDILITGGGTILYDESNRFFVPFWFIKIFIAQLFRKPTAFYGIGVGPLDRKFSAFLMNTLGKRMNFISLRGVESLKCMEKFKVPKHKVLLTADPAVTIYCAEEKMLSDYYAKENIHLNKLNETVVIVIREWFERPNRGLEDAQNGISIVKSYEDYVKQFAEFARYLIETENDNIVFMPMGSMPPCDDRIVMKDVVDYLHNKSIDTSNVFLMSDIADPRIMTSIMAEAKAVITTRFHGLVYATSQNIPAIAVAYTTKYYDYYNYLGLSEYVISMNEFSTDVLIKKYKQILEKKDDYLKVLEREMPHQFEMAQKNAKLVADILRRKDK
mgnify:CR=1 FL=1